MVYKIDLYSIIVNTLLSIVYKKAQQSVPSPLVIRTSARFALSSLMVCSPRTQRTASATLLLPLPFGPTTAVIPESNASSVLLAKVLKPWISSRLKYKEASGFQGKLFHQRRFRGRCDAGSSRALHPNPPIPRALFWPRLVVLLACCGPILVLAL